MTNGETILRASGLTESQEACMALLEEALAEAKRGKINSIGIIACMPGGFATVMTGTQPGELNLGCDELKHKIREAVTGAAKPVRGSILKVTR